MGIDVAAVRHRCGLEPVHGRRLDVVPRSGVHVGFFISVGLDAVSLRRLELRSGIRLGMVPGQDLEPLGTLHPGSHSACRIRGADTAISNRRCASYGVCRIRWQDDLSRSPRQARNCAIEPDHRASERTRWSDVDKADDGRQGGNTDDDHHHAFGWRQTGRDGGYAARSGCSTHCRSSRPHVRRDNGRHAHLG